MSNKNSTKQIQLDGICRRVEELQAEFKEWKKADKPSGQADIARLEEFVCETERYLEVVLKMRDELLKIH